MEKDGNMAQTAFRLTVQISGGPQQASPPAESTDDATRTLAALPLQVYAADGRLLAAGTGSCRAPARFVLKKASVLGQAPTDATPRVYVLARLPDGRTIQERVLLQAGDNRMRLQLNGGDHAWLQWVAPFRSLGHLDAPGESGGATDATAITHAQTSGANKSAPRRIGPVWAVLWRLGDAGWTGESVAAENMHSDRGIREFRLQIPLAPHLLQVGGQYVAWQLISLPPGGPVRVALTPSPGNTGDRVQITVARQPADNELMMAYLAQGAVREAGAMIDTLPLAAAPTPLPDDIAALAQAYVHYKTHQHDLCAQSLQGLVDHAPWLADAKILQAALAREQDDVAQDDIRQMLLEATARGLPLFAPGLSLLMEGLAALHRGQDETPAFHDAYLATQAYVRAARPGGAYLCFRGKSPGEPDPVPVRGQQHKATTDPGLVSYGQTLVVLPGAQTQDPTIMAGPSSRLGRGSAIPTVKRIVQPQLPGLKSLPRHGALQDTSRHSMSQALGPIVRQIGQPMLLSTTPLAVGTDALGPMVQASWQEERARNATALFAEDE